MKMSKRQSILKWMKNNVKAKHHGNCFFYAATLALLFPQLKLIKGPPPHKGKGKHRKDTAHFWTEDKKGNVYDPTASQLEKDYEYKGKIVNPKKNIDFVIKDELFKKLPKKNQEIIEKMMTFKLSKRAAFHLSKEELEEIQKNFGEFANRLGAWDVHLKDVANTRALLATANFVKELAEKGDFDNNFVASFLAMQTAPSYHVGYVMWPTLLGDFGLNPDISGNTNHYVLKFSGPNIGFDKAMKAVDIIGVFAETKGQIVPIGNVYNPDLTELFPPELFQTWTKVLYSRYFIRAQRGNTAAFLAEANGKYCSAHFESPYIEERMDTIGSYDLFKEEEAPKIAKYMKIIQSKPVFNHEERMDTDEFWDSLEEPEHTYEEPEDHYEEANNQMFSISKRASTMSTEDFTKAMLIDVLSSNQVDDVHSPGSTMADIVVGLESLGYEDVAREISNSKPNSQDQRIALLKAGQLLDIPGISQLLETKPEWTPNGWVVKGNLNISELGLTTLKYLNIYEVGGDFYCSYNQLTSLQGAPQKVGGSFFCFSNQLTSLQEAPQKVGGNFLCHNNQLTSLQGAPQKVGGSFYCSYNQLTSLQGAPQKVGGDFLCHNNQLTSLQGAPQEVGDSFLCHNNQLTSLQGAPQEVGDNFLCHNNQLTSLQGAPQKVGGDFFCENNPLDEEKTKESQSCFSISKRAQVTDLRELFPPSVFAGFTQNKSPWFITEYRPDKVQAFLRVDNSVIRFNARLFSRRKRNKFYFSLRWPKEFNPMGKEDLQSRYSSFLTSDKDEAKNHAEQIAGIIGEFTLQKEQAKPSAGPELRIKQDFPPEIFVGWDNVEWRPDSSLSAYSQKLGISLSVMAVRHLGTRELSHYNIFLRFPNQPTFQYNIEPDLLNAPLEKGDSVIQVIKNIGKRAQDIELSASLKLSKRATYEHLIEERPEEETQAADLLKEHFPYIPPEIFGGWRIFAYTPEIFKGHELNNVYQFNAKLIVEGKELAEFVIVKNFFPNKPPHSFLVLEWNASLGDFDTGLIGSPVVWELSTEEEIMENLPKVLNIIEKLGVEAESQTYLKQRNMEFAPKPEGNLPNIDLTKIIPKELLFGNIHSYVPHYIDLEDKFIDFMMTTERGHVNLNISLPKGTVDDALSKYIIPGPPEETPDAYVVVFVDIESVSKLNELIEPIKNTLKNAKSWINKQASFQLSKRAIKKIANEEEKRYIQKRYFPYLPLHIFAGWDNLEAKEESHTEYLEPRITANTKFSVGGQTEFAEFFVNYSPQGSKGKVRWPMKLGDFNLSNLKEDSILERYTLSFVFPNDLKVVANLVEKIGAFSETARLSGKEYSFLPVGKPHKPTEDISTLDFRKFFPRELFEDWEGVYKRNIIQFRKEGDANIAVFSIIPNPQNKDHFLMDITYARDMDIPSEFSEYSHFDDEISLNSMDVNHWSPLGALKYVAPPAIKLIKYINEDWEKRKYFVDEEEEEQKEYFRQLDLEKLIQQQKEDMESEASFQLSKRASENTIKYVQRKYFPKFPLSALAGWDTIEVDYNTPFNVGSRLLGISLNASAHFPKQNDIADAWFCLKDVTYHQNATVMWPTQLGNLNVDASRSSVSNKYSKNYMYPEELKEMIYVLDTIGGFAESMRLAEESGRSTDKIVPIGKAYDPDLTKIFPKEMFYGWEPFPSNKKTEIKMMVPGKDLPHFMAEARGDIRVDITYRNEEVFIPPSLRNYAEKTKDITTIKIKKHDFKEIEALAPAIKELISNIYKVIAKPEKEASMRLSKRASIDLREYFPLATFAGMATEKIGWFIEKYEPNFIRASLNFNDFQIKFGALKGKTKFNIQLGNPFDENRKSWWQISKEEFEKVLPEIHRNIAEYTLMKEEEEPESQINKDFPPDLFKGWSFYSPSQNDIKAAIKMGTTIIIRNIGDNRYHIIFLGSQKLPIEGNSIETPEDLKKIQDFIKDLGKKAQKINLEANMRLSKRASEIANDFPPEIFMGWREVDYEENRISAESGHDEIRRADIFRSRMGDFYWMEIFDYEGNVIQDFRAPVKDPSSIIDVIKNIGSQTESSSPPYINKEVQENV